MLVLTRKREERLLIGDDVQIVVVRIDGQQVRLGVIAPTGMRIIRAELEPRQLHLGNHEKHVEDIGSGPGSVTRDDARRIIEWRDDIDNTVFPVDLQSAACRLAAAKLAE